MSWLARSIASSLKLDDNEEDENNNVTTANTTPQNSPFSQSPKGVKEDLTELSQTLTRQFWGVASFLAPPPSEQSPPSDPELIEGIKTDFAEFGGKVRTGISKISQNLQASEFTKLASNFLQLGDDGLGSSYEVGVTDEVVAFARDIAMRPETWIEFPVPPVDGRLDDFELSDAQQEHALAVERLAPRLAALRIELCPVYMSESCFWMIYFALLLPRLSKHDAQLLITPQVIEARAMLRLNNEFQNQSEAKSQIECSQTGASTDKESVDSLPDQHLSVPSRAQTESSPQTSSRGDAASFDGQIQSVEHISSVGESPSSPQTEAVQLKSSASGAEPSSAANVATEKPSLQATEKPMIHKSVTGEESTKQLSQSESSPKVVDEKYEDDGDDWLKEESSEIVGISGSSIPIENDEDVSFSDLEDDDGDEPTSYKNVTSGSESSAKDSRDWVQLSGSSAESVKAINAVKIRHDGSEQVRAQNTEKEDSNDWLNIDEIDEM